MITRRTALRATSGALVMLTAARATATEETARRRMTMEIKRSGSEASRKGPLLPGFSLGDIRRYAYVSR
jgi:hypothetical protein